MDLGVRAQESSLSAMFSPGQRLVMPPYQRSYSWDEAEALDLYEDLTDAAAENTTHFIGAVVLVKGNENGVAELVDGQQRLTTATILLCVLRDLEPDAARRDALHTLVGDSERPMFGEGANWRLTLNHMDGPFFHEAIQTPGATLKLVKEPAESESQQRMVGNAIALREEIRKLTPEARRKLADTVVNGCSLVKVYVEDKERGFKVFRVLNTRGKEPDAHDIIKTELFQRAHFTPQDAYSYSERWAEQEAALGGAAFDDLLRQIRAIYDRNAKGDLLSGFQKIVPAKITPRKFLDQILPDYVKAYTVVTTAKVDGGPNAAIISDKLNQLRALEQQNWRAPAIKFIVECGLNHSTAPLFFANLERLSYVLQLIMNDRDQRQKRLARVTDAITDERTLFSKSGPFAIGRDEIRKVRERLLGRFATFGQRRALALRLNAALEGGRTLTPESDSTVEHVLPRNLSEDSHWMTTWPDPAKRREQCDTLGNFVLLTLKMNQEADRLDFHAKKQIYFKEAGGTEFALTRDLRELDAWTSEIVRKRTERLADILMHQWGF